MEENTNQHLVGNEAWDIWADLNGSSSLTTRYLRGDVIDQLFARVDSGTTYWELADRLGSIRDVVDNSAVVKDSINYNGFGEIISETDANYRGRYAWTGRELDTETDFQYNHARYYDAPTGRWISEDPLGFDAGDSNLYRYVANRTTAQSDSSGLIGVFFGGYTQTVNTQGAIQDLHNRYLGPKMFVAAGGWDISASVNAYTNEPFNTIVAIRAAEAVANAFGLCVPRQRVDIFGFSRGGTFAIVLSQRLKGRGINVDFLGLIDAVKTQTNAPGIEYLNDPAKKGLFYMRIYDNVVAGWYGRRTEGKEQHQISTLSFPHRSVRLEPDQLPAGGAETFRLIHTEMDDLNNEPAAALETAARLADVPLDEKKK